MLDIKVGIGISNMKTKCEVCQIEWENDDIKKLMSIQFEHNKTKEHMSNVEKFLIYDTESLTLEEALKKICNE